jgi:Tol biopolymer transport system component
MKAMILKTFFLLTLILLAAGNSWSQTADQLFQKGIMKEEGEGSLREAIDLYKSVADNKQADRALRAKALYQMGNCYEKLGQQEARSIYEKLVANYSDQPTLVADAKKKLNKLNADQSISENSGILIRQVSNFGVDLNGYSPDGKYATYNDWDAGNIGVVDLKSGNKWEITKDGNWESHYTLFSTWSPDSKQIVYDWNIEESGKDNDTFNYELHIVDKDGKNDRVIIKNGNKNLWAEDWSKDGTLLLCIEGVAGRTDHCKLALISVKDGSKKIISDIGNARHGNANFTDDGNYIVFRAPSDKKPENSDIFIVSKDGGAVRPLISNNEDDEAPFRVLNTNQFVYFSYHTGTKDLWTMTIKDGKLQDEPGILKSNFDQSSKILGTNNFGTLFFTSYRLNADIYKASLDFKNNEVKTVPLNIKRNSGRQIIRVSWSPSFKYVAGILQTPYDPETLSAPLKFVIQDVQSGEEHEISPDLRSFTLSGWTEPQWTPDEKSILIKGVNKDGNKGLYLIDVQTGKASPYITPMEYPHWVWRWLQFSPDGETQYFVSQEGIGPKQKVIARAVKSGKEKVLAEFNHWVERMSLSPDGKTLAILQDSLWVLPVDGSSAKKNLTNYKVMNGNIIGWSSDNQSIYVASDNTKKDLHLWQISLGNEPAKELFSPEKLKEFKEMYRIKISHAGDKAYLTMENGKRIDEYWAIENIAQK